MKMCKKTFLFVVLLAIAGQQARADWSWLTVGIGRFFAPIAHHWGKVLIGLGAVASPVIYCVYGQAKKRKKLRLAEIAKKKMDEVEAAELDGIAAAWKEQEEGRQKLKKNLDLKINAFQNSSLEDLTKLKTEAENINDELVKLGGEGQGEWIGLAVDHYLRAQMSRLSSFLDGQLDMPAVENYEKQIGIIQELVEKDGSVPARAALSDLQYKMGETLARECKREVKPGEFFKVGVSLGEQINQMWGDAYKQQLALVDKLAKLDKDKAMPFYLTLAQGRLDGGYHKLRKAFLASGQSINSDGSGREHESVKSKSLSQGKEIDACSSENNSIVKTIESSLRAVFDSNRKVIGGADELSSQLNGRLRSCLSGLADKKST